MLVNNVEIPVESKAKQDSPETKKKSNTLQPHTPIPMKTQNGTKQEEEKSNMLCGNRRKCVLRFILNIYYTLKKEADYDSEKKSSI